MKKLSSSIGSIRPSYLTESFHTSSVGTSNSHGSPTRLDTPSDAQSSSRSGSIFSSILNSWSAGRYDWHRLTKSWFPNFSSTGDEKERLSPPTSHSMLTMQEKSSKIQNQDNHEDFTENSEEELPTPESSEIRPPQHIPGRIPFTGTPHLDAFLDNFQKTEKTSSVRLDQPQFSSRNSSGHTMKTQQSGGSTNPPMTGTDTPSHCTMRAVIDETTGRRTIECVPTTTSCPTSTAAGSHTLWAITRVPFNDVPASSLFLAESMSNLNYDMDYATINTFPFMIAQMGLRNFSPFEQFLTAKCSKAITNQVAFRYVN